jgi:hypothetical protein
MVISTVIYSLQQGLTHSALLAFFCGDGENVENLNHYCCDRVHHSFIWRHSSVCVQTSEKSLYAFEQLKKDILVRPNVLSCLKIVRITMAHTNVSRSLTEIRIPNPIKITFAGENTFKQL